MSLPIKIQLPESFLLSEIRDGYSVSSRGKKIWAVELDLFSEFSRVCQKHDIAFSVAFGTMIGAVRHKGFIPWDDDFDIMLERAEYEKLLSVGPHEFKHPYFFQYALNERNVFTPLARLRNSETTGYASGSPTSSSYNNGIYLDLYCFDANPQNRVKYLWKHFLKRVVGKLLGIYYQQVPCRQTLMQHLMFGLKPVAHLVSYESLWFWYCEVLKLYNEDEDHYSHMLTAQVGGRADWISHDALTDVVLVPYEFIKVPIVKDYDRYLRSMYGDYMSFPPLEQRGKWHEGQIHFEPEVPYKQYFANMKTGNHD